MIALFTVPRIVQVSVLPFQRQIGPGQQELIALGRPCGEMNQIFRTERVNAEQGAPADRYAAVQFDIPRTVYLFN